MDTRKGDIIFGSATILFAAYVFYEGLQFPSAAGGFPKLVSGLLASAGLMLVIKAIIRKSGTTPLFAGVKFPVLITCALLWLVAIILSKYLGFFFVAFIFLVSVAWILLGKSFHLRRFLGVITFAITTTAVMWFLFVYVLQVNMPVGLFF